MDPLVKDKTNALDLKSKSQIQQSSYSNVKIDNTSSNYTVLNRDNMMKDMYITALWKFTRFAIYSMSSFRVLKANS